MVCAGTDSSSTARVADLRPSDKMATITQTTQQLRVRSKGNLTIRTMDYEDVAQARYLFVEGMRSLILPIFWKVLYHPVFLGLLVASSAGLLVSTSVKVTLFFLGFVLAAVYVFSYYKFYEYVTFSLRDDLADIEKYYLKRPRSNFWVAEVDGQVVGIVALDEKSDRIAELRRMSVDSSVRGRGIAQKLLKNLVEFSRLHGYKEITLSTSTLQAPAIRLYQKSGFEHVGSVHMFIGISMESFKYEL